MASVADESSSSGDDSKSQRHLFLTVLMYYGIFTGIVMAMMACAAIPFVCHACCRRDRRGGANDNVSGINAAGDTTDATTDAADGTNPCNSREAGRVICAALCWPVLVIVAMGAMLVEAMAACQRCLLPPRQRDYTSDVANLDRSSTATHFSP
eukprot:g12716.t1